MITESPCNSSTSNRLGAVGGSASAIHAEYHCNTDLGRFGGTRAVFVFITSQPNSVWTCYAEPASLQITDAAPTWPQIMIQLRRWNKRSRSLKHRPTARLLQVEPVAG